MKYLVVGPTITNNIYVDNELTISQQLGGAIYALTGILLWDDSALYVSNVGPDFATYYAEWFKDNKVSEEGLFFTLPHTQYTDLIYLEDELHDEKSIYGPAEDELIEQLDLISVAQLKFKLSSDTRGIYIEISEQDPFWQELEDLKQDSSIKIMWEVRTSSVSTKARRLKTLETINKVDIFSVNLPEAKMLFAEDDFSTVVKAIMELDTACFLRLGKQGSMMIANKEYAFAPSLSLGPVIDTTGCGNASTAAALVGVVENRSLLDTVRMGNIAAWFNLEQNGPHPQIAHKRKRAKELLADYP